MNHLVVFFFTLFSMSSASIFSQSVNSYEQQHLCPDSCDCGCKEGGECHCNHEQNSSSQGNMCDDSCDCGCKEGGECNCNHEEKYAFSFPNSCDDSCNCGCKEGGECHCNDNKYDYQQPHGRYGFNPQQQIDDEFNHQYCLQKYKNDVIEYKKDIKRRRAAARYWQQAHCVYLGPYGSLDGDCAKAFNCGCYGVWLPEDGLLFKPFVADPRQVTYSVGWRFNDQVVAKNVIPISFGDNLGIYRWCAVWPCWGQMQVDLEGALWGVFDPLHHDTPLVNADYYVGIPVTYAIGRWAFRLRPYHISSHIGDEFLLCHPGFDRRNPSAEYIDWAVSYYLTRELRVYSNIGWIVQYDNSFIAGNWYAELGAELRFVQAGFFDGGQHLFGHPFFGMQFGYNNYYDRHIDCTYVLGYEWGKTAGSQRCVRAFMEYHSGYSVEGQFRKYPTDYFSLRLTYGY